MTRRTSRYAGFSLLELMIAVGILTVLIGAVVRLANDMVRTNDRVAASVDTVQQGRQFMDQIAADLHMAGFPNYGMINHSNNTASTDQQYWSGDSLGHSQSGIISASGTQLQFEGDVDNSGTISEVILQLCVTGTNCTAPTSNSDCPCTMRRGTIAKSTYVNTTPTPSPAYYTELSNVMNYDPFKYWFYNGVAWDGVTMDNLRVVEVKLQVRSQNKDLQTNNYPVVTLDSEVKLSNY